MDSSFPLSLNLGCLECGRLPVFLSTFDFLFFFSSLYSQFQCGVFMCKFESVFEITASSTVQLQRFDNECLNFLKKNTRLKTNQKCHTSRVPLCMSLQRAKNDISMEITSPHSLKWSSKRVENEAQNGNEM